MKFAEGTTVAVSKTRGQIEELAAKHGATRFASGWTEKGAAINFVCRGRLLRFVLPVPDREEIARELRKRRRSFPTAKMIDDAAAAEERRRWRALLLVIKGRFESAEDGIETFDEAFLAHIVTADNMTIIEHLQVADSPIKLLTAGDGN
jgi:hypothetical protein